MPESYPYETGNIADFDSNLIPSGADTVDWTDPALARVTRLRLVTDPGCPFWDVSYCYGVTRDGTPVRVRLGFYQVPRGKVSVSSFIVAQARAAGVFAKGLGILDAISCLW